jgi:CheY-like chemotaxis protein
VKLLHIILADDDDDDQLIIRQAIKDFSNQYVHITCVKDGIELLKYLKENPDTTANAIILDINMPKMDGLEALEQIRISLRKDIPVFMLSTLRTQDRYNKSMQLGAKNFYTKPNFSEGYREVIGEIFSAVI